MKQKRALGSERKMTDNKPVRIPVMLDKQRYFQVDLAAAIRWENITGKAIFSPKVWAHINKKNAFLMMWACLTSDDPTLKPDDLRRIFDTSKIDQKKVFESIDKLNLAWGDLMISVIGGEQHGH